MRGLLTLRLAALLALAAALLLTSLAWPQPLPFVGAVVAWVAALLGVALPWLSLRGLDAQVLPGPALQLARRVRWPAAMLQFEARWRWGGRELAMRQGLPWLAGGAAARLELGALFPCRGHYELVELRLSCGFPLGLVEPALRLRPAGVRHLVLPEPAAVELPPLAHDVEDPRSEQVTRRLGQSTELGLLLPYQPGEALRRVHWRASARAGALVIQHFHQSGAPALRIVCELPDAAQAGHADAPAELAVRVAAGLAWRAGAAGVRVQAQLRAGAPAVDGGDDIGRALAAAEPEALGLGEAIRAAAETMRDGETLAVVIGATAPADELLRALAAPALRTHRLAVYVAQHAPGRCAIVDTLRAAGLDVWPTVVEGTR